MELEKDERWTILASNCKTLDDFVSKVIPKFYLWNSASDHVRNAFVRIRKLLIHSYYEYEFMDVAMHEIFLHFEMALKLRYEELEGKAWKGTLQRLLSWFSDRGYFEVDHDEYLDIVRRQRNLIAHPEQYTVSGISVFHPFSAVLGLINDVYANPEERKKRLAEQRKFNEFLKGLTTAGAVVQTPNAKEIIYRAGILHVNLTPGYEEVFGFVYKIFPLKHEREPNTDPKNPVRYFS